MINILITHVFRNKSNRSKKMIQNKNYSHKKNIVKKNKKKFYKIKINIADNPL